MPDIRLGSTGTLSTIDLGPLPPRNQVTVELDISPDADVGPGELPPADAAGHELRKARFLVEPYYGETPDKEPNDTPEEAFETFAPTILVGDDLQARAMSTITRSTSRAGEELVFENAARMLGSALAAADGDLLDASTWLQSTAGTAPNHVGRFSPTSSTRRGTYYVRVADYQGGGKARHFYRIKVGRFPLVISVLPLGVNREARRGEISRASISPPATLPVNGEPSREDEDASSCGPTAPASRSTR